MPRRAALVTGASYGVGAATALALARAGHDVAITATRTDNLRRTVENLADTGARVVPLALDLRMHDSIVRAFGEALAALGQIDVLVNKAAVNLRRHALELHADAGVADA